MKLEAGQVKHRACADRRSLQQVILVLDASLTAMRTGSNRHSVSMQSAGILQRQQRERASRPHIAMPVCCTGGEVWLEHGYFSDRQDLQATAPGQQYLQQYGLGEFEVVGESFLYHSPASLIEGGPCFCATDFRLPAFYHLHLLLLPLLLLCAMPPAYVI